MRVCRDAVGIDQIPALRVTHSAFGYHLAVTDISGAHGAALDVLHRFGDRFDLLFNMIQAFCWRTASAAIAAIISISVNGCGC